MKSKTVDATLFTKISKAVRAVSEDRLPHFAAESSFFICISAIPFIMLLISLSRLAVPNLVDDLIGIVRAVVPESSRDFFDGVVSDVTDRSAFPILPTAALSALWAASRGLISVVRGVAQIFGRRVEGSAVTRAVRSVVYTAIFIVVMAATLVMLVFGKYFRDALTSSIGEVPMFVRYREVIVFFVLTLFFSLLYFLVAKGTFSSKLFRWDRGSDAKFREQLPGAALAALGWIVFSFAYSLYFEAFPRFSYLYGSLAALVFLMLWLYFCILILLAGAEVNKMLLKRNK